MEPVCNDDGSPFFIPVGTVRAVNKERSCNTIGVLRAVVTMVPSMTVLGKFELVLEGITFSSWALSDA